MTTATKEPPAAPAADPVVEQTNQACRAQFTTQLRALREKADDLSKSTKTVCERMDSELGKEQEKHEKKCRRLREDRNAVTSDARRAREALNVALAEWKEHIERTSSVVLGDMHRERRDLMTQAKRRREHTPVKDEAEPAGLMEQKAIDKDLADVEARIRAVLEPPA